MAQQGTNDSRQDARNGFAGWFHAPFVGIACVLAWAFQVNALAGTGDVSDQTAWIASYIALSLVMPVMGLIAKRIPRVVSFKTIPFAAAAAGAVGTRSILCPRSLAGVGAPSNSYAICRCIRWYHRPEGSSARWPELATHRLHLKGTVDDLNRGRHDAPRVNKFGQAIQSLVGDGDDAYVWLDRAKGKICRLRLSVAQAIE